MIDRKIKGRACAFVRRLDGATLFKEEPIAESSIHMGRNGASLIGVLPVRAPAPSPRRVRQPCCTNQAIARSYQPRDRRTICTTESMTGTSTRMPTTVASAAPDWKPKSAIAVATASSKKLLDPDRHGDAAPMLVDLPERAALPVQRNSTL